MSATHAAVNPSTGTAHKRAGSQLKLDSRTTGPSIISLFVKNVRLLNLDLLPDWPVLTPASLSNQDARARIRGTEWCLYQLFRVYDPATTSDKLQPFFPPLEPLQSINLRAALYRCLNEMKKNGVLARETVLRKTMLDECQGDKFWELCLNFSSLVLRKVIVEQKNGTAHGMIGGKPVAERIGTANSVPKVYRESMLPLAVAHRAALTKILREKERKRSTFVRLHDVLVEKDADLQRRKTNVTQRARQDLVPPSNNGQNSSASRSDKLKVAQEVLNHHWVGSNELQAALMYGGDSANATTTSAAAGDFLLTTPFDDLWEANQEGKLAALGTAKADVLQDLDSRARQQRRRLERWQNFHEKLIKHARSASAIPLSTPAAASRTEAVSKRDIPMCFDRHQSLSIHDMEDLPRPTPAERNETRKRASTVLKYDEILTAMREELRRNASSITQQPPQTVAAKQREPTDDARRASSRLNMSPSPTEGHRRSPSQTAVPMRAHLSRRVSSKSRSYAQPKVISQRELVPLKSELFSPLKGKRMSIFASPTQEEPHGLGNDYFRRGSESSVGHYAPRGTNPHDSAVVVGGAASSAHCSSRASSRSGHDFSDSAIDVAPGSNRSSVASHPGMQRVNTASVAATPVRMSLSERTRLSMAPRINTNDNDDELLSPSGDAEQDSASLSPSSQRPPVPFPATASLTERTRNSIALAPPVAPLRMVKIRPQAQHTRSRSSMIYPVNQFETPPSKASRRSSGAQSFLSQRRATVDEGSARSDAHSEQDSAPKRDFTPREKLFSADAEYDSVFKARPKIALSPVLSPRDSGHGGMTLPNEGFEIDSGSPTTGR